MFETVEKYGILDIRQFTIEPFGKVMVIRANPAWEYCGRFQCNDMLCKDTKWFIAPLSMADSIVAIAQSKKLWAITEGEFYGSILYFEEEDKEIDVSIHHSLQITHSSSQNKVVRFLKKIESIFRR